MEDSWVGLRWKTPSYIKIQWIWKTNKGYLLLEYKCSVHSGTKTTSKTICWLGEKLLPRWRVPVSQLPIKMSSNCRKELYKMAGVARGGSRDSGSGCVSLSSTDWARKVSTCWLAKTNTVRHWQGGGHWGTAEPPQSCTLSKDCHRISETRPVVSCHPLWDTAQACNDSWPMMCQDFTSHLPRSPTCTEQGPFPPLPPPEELNEGINGGQDGSGHPHMSSPAVTLAMHRHARTKRGVSKYQLCWAKAAVT